MEEALPLNQDFTSFDAIQAIESERIYQARKWGDAPRTIGEYILILEKTLNDTKAALIRGDGSVMHEIRQVTTVGFACMQEHGAPRRGAPIVDTSTRELL